jgi:hypothetical protein
VPLSGRLGRGLYALVDAEDYDLVMQYRWNAQVFPKSRTIYAQGWPPKDTGLPRPWALHRLVMGARRGDPEIDHKNGDGLDCRKDNLRRATRSQNAANTGLGSRNKSGYKGVNWYPRYGKWRAAITSQGRRKTLGYFTSIEDAARAYDEAALRLHGEFALTNQDILLKSLLAS